jgi:hypothetical protein
MEGIKNKGFINKSKGGLPLNDEPLIGTDDSNCRIDNLYLSAAYLQSRFT